MEKNLTKSTKELITEIDYFTKICISQIDMDDIKEMSPEIFELYRRLFRMLGKSSDLLLLYSEKLDSIDSKLDLLLKK